MQQLALFPISLSSASNSVTETAGVNSVAPGLGMPANTAPSGLFSGLLNSATLSQSARNSNAADTTITPESLLHQFMSFADSEAGEGLSDGQLLTEFAAQNGVTLPSDIAQLDGQDAVNGTLAWLREQGGFKANEEQSALETPAQLNSLHALLGGMNGMLEALSKDLPAEPSASQVRQEPGIPSGLLSRAMNLIDTGVQNAAYDGGKSNPGLASYSASLLAPAALTPLFSGKGELKRAAEQSVPSLSTSLQLNTLPSGDNSTSLQFGGANASYGTVVDATGLPPAAVFRSESDHQFSAFFDTLKQGSAADASAGLDELVTLKPLESAAVNRNVDVQARIPGNIERPYATGLSLPVGDPEWSDEMGQKIVWLSGRNIRSAEIHLNPAELGPVDVKISIQNDQASVTFNVQSASVREMLESNVHRLREMMSAEGVDLSEVNVDAGRQDQQYASGDGAKQGGGTAPGADAAEQEDAEQVAVTQLIDKTSENIVDYFV